MCVYGNYRLTFKLTHVVCRMRTTKSLHPKMTSNVCSKNSTVTVAICVGLIEKPGEVWSCARFTSPSDDEVVIICLPLAGQVDKSCGSVICGKRHCTDVTYVKRIEIHAWSKAAPLLNCSRTKSYSSCEEMVAMFWNRHVSCVKAPTWVDTP